MFGLTKTKINTDEKTVDEILTRGIENIYPSRDFLRAKLLSGQKISIYLGIDPTIVRLLFVLGFFLGGHFGIVLLYIIMALIIPEEPLTQIQQ